MADTRYHVVYIPASECERIANENAVKIAAGASVWDIAPPETLEKTITRPTLTAALAEARRVAPLDECGEVRVYEQTEMDDDDFPYWEQTRYGAFYEGDCEITWLEVR